MMVYIILVNYNGFADTIECLNSLREIDYKDYKVIVVDNASSDNSLKKLSDIADKDLIILNSSDNIGFAGGNNIGIQYALEDGAEYVLLLNNDTIVTADFLSRLMNCAKEQGQNAIISPKIMYAYDRQRIWFAGGTFDPISGRTAHIGINEPDHGEYDVTKEVSFISGCCMLIPAHAIRKTGLMDESYFLYCEDLDYCCRFLKSGFKIVYCPVSVIYHKVSASTGKQSGTAVYYTVRNKFFIIKEYISKKYQLTARTYTWLEIIKRVLCGEYAISSVCEGFRDYKKNKAGKRYNYIE